MTQCELDPSNVCKTANSLHSWCIRHDAQDEIRWKQQDELNRRMEDFSKEVFSRINTIDRRLMWICGVGAGIGTVAGTILAVVVSHVIGG